jgi:hypothetical protein
MRPKIDAVDYYPEEMWDDGWDYTPPRLIISRHGQEHLSCHKPTWTTIQRAYRVCKQRGGEFWEDNYSLEWHWEALGNIYA